MCIRDSSYTEDQARTIAGVRYELSIKSLTDAQYVFADDVSVELISQTADGQYRGVSTGTSSARVYNTEYAAHVLGRLSPIYYEDWVGDPKNGICLLYTSDAADDLLCVELGGRRHNKKKKK